MRYLLDTHILFWSMSDETRLSEQVLLMINDPEKRNHVQQCFVSSLKFEALEL